MIFQSYDECEENYKKLKTLLTFTRVLTLPKEGFYFSSYCDASEVRLGSTLIHKGNMIAYDSRLLKTYERN